MTQDLEKITKSLKGICRMASKYEIGDILRPGLLRRLVVASHLGHTPVFNKNFHAQDERHKYYYFTAWNRNRFQTGMISKGEVSSMEGDFFCFVFFDDKDQFQVLRSYMITRDKFLPEAERQISGKKKSNVSISERWLRRNS